MLAAGVLPTAIAAGQFRTAGQARAAATQQLTSAERFGDEGMTASAGERPPTRSSACPVRQVNARAGRGRPAGSGR